MSADELDRITALFTQGFDNINARLDLIETRLTKLEADLRALDMKVEERLHDTRPMWQGIQTELSGFRAETDKNFRKFGRQIDQIVKDVFEIRTDQKDLQGRVDSLEEKIS